MAQELDDVCEPNGRAAQEETDADIAVREGSWTWRSITIAVVIVVAVFGGLGWAIVESPYGEPAPQSDPAAAWRPLGGPDLDRGGAYVYTRCEGSTELLLTVDASGFPVGPVVPVLYGEGCRAGAR